MRLERIKKLCAEATPGPWRKGRDDMDSFDAQTGEQFANVYGPHEVDHPSAQITRKVPTVVARVLAEGSDDCHVDARFVAEARILLPWLADWAERAVNHIGHIPGCAAAHSKRSIPCNCGMVDLIRELREGPKS